MKCGGGRAERHSAYDALFNREVLQKDRNFILCANSECDSGQFHAGGWENHIVICGSCGMKTCFIHRDIPWHEGLTCKEYEVMKSRTDDEVSMSVNQAKMLNAGFYKILRMKKSLQEERRKISSATLAARYSLEMRLSLLGEKTVVKSTKPCPGCRIRIEKVGGCKHMMCMFTLSHFF